MAQITNDSVVTETARGWGAHVMTNGPRFMGAAALVLIGAFIAVRVFVGEFVADGKIALALTAITCVVSLFMALAAPLIVWIIRETSKASVAGVSQQVSETNQLVKSSIEQNSAVMNALIALTSQHIQSAGAGVQLPSAPAQPAYQIQPARHDLTIDGRGVQWDKATISKAAARIYYTLYEKRIEPTQANIKTHVADMQSTSLVSAAMQELKALGWAESSGSGSGYKWVYDDAPAPARVSDESEPPSSPTAGAGGA